MTLPAGLSVVPVDSIPILSKEVASLPTNERFLGGERLFRTKVRLFCESTGPS